MTQLAEHPTMTTPQMAKPRYLLLSIAFAVLTLLVATGTFFLGLSRSQSGNTHPATAPTMTFTGQCASNVISTWTPVDTTWKLTVQFLNGSRQGQSEQSIMTFRHDGSLTATFPSQTPSDPPTLPPAVDGHWCMTAPNAFHYQFRDLMQQNGRTVAYVQTQISADMTSATSYIAGGIGMAYSAQSGQPLPGQYGLTRTLATAGQ